ncbi:MAG: SDR family oxidoreductase, partial [Myxococcota bacterium]|nr:SDR family oxidoreductase [Myxococcota bacterium]
MKDAHIFLTGATGFLGKVVLEELMRRQDELGVQKVYLLIRDRGDIRAEERFLTSVLTSPCFDRLHEGWEDAVEVVRGDLAVPGCGIDYDAREMLRKRVTHVIHSAASVEFDLPIEQAAEANITSSLNVLSLARSCQRLRHMVAVSTAYVSPHENDYAPIPEALAALPAPASAIYGSIRDGSADEAALLKSAGLPNTYTFTKNISEHLLWERRGAVPLSIVRPSIIGCSVQHPVPGWIDSYAGYAGFVALIGSGEMKVISGRPNSRLDVIPVDSVSERVIDCCLGVTDTELARDAKEPVIRHATSGVSMANSVATCANATVDFFQDHRIRRRPGLIYVGRPGLRMALGEMRFHRLRSTAGKLWFTATRQPKMKRLVSRVGDKLISINRSFPYFTQNTFNFQSSVPLDPEVYDREAYPYLVCRGVLRHLLRQDETRSSLAGRQHRELQPDLLWTLARPEGNMTHRAFAYVLKKLAQRCLEHVTFDRPSFESAKAQVPEDSLLVLVPNHRSYTDFLLVSYLFYARPDLGISIPRIAAAEEFSRIPVLGQAFERMGAFYLKRGAGKEDPELTQRIHELVQNKETLEFFIEGTRSRSRQYLAPRRGLLRCLQNTGQPVTVLPVSITYDRVPEEEIFLREIQGGQKPAMSLRKVIAWAQRVLRGEIELGRIHVTCGSPLPMDAETDVRALSGEVMDALQANTATTEHHLRSFLLSQPIRGVDLGWMKKTLERRGGQVLES